MGALHIAQGRKNLFDRSGYEVWIQDGSKALRAQAQERVEEILKSHRPDPLPASILNRLDEIVRGGAPES